MSELTQSASFIEVMRSSDLSVGARLLWWELNQWVTGDLNVCFPTQSQLANNIGVHRNTVIRWMRELREQGLVRDEPRAYGNAYSLHIGD